MTAIIITDIIFYLVVGFYCGFLAYKADRKCGSMTLMPILAIIAWPLILLVLGLMELQELGE